MPAGDKLKKQKYTVKILGEKLTVTGDISEDYIEKLAGYINRIGEEIISVYPRLPRRKLIGLATVNLADEIFKLREEKKNRDEEIKHLKKEKKRLENKINSLQDDYRELSVLLEEVDR
ncbi:MAG: cell division protein ZapA [Halanaerobiaceae bacterium]